MSDHGDNTPQTALEAVVRAVVVRHIDASPVRVSPQSGGLSNRAFQAETEHDHFIVRLGDAPDKLTGFERERRAVERARKAGVPTQEVVALGQEGAWAYSISHRLPGVPAVDHPERLHVLESLAELAATVHTIPTAGCGGDYGWPGEPAPNAQSWTDFLHVELDADRRIRDQRDHDMISERQQQALEATLAEVEMWDESPVLQHGDLRLKNVIVDAAGCITGLIDWETSVSSIGPHWDISVALHDLSIDAKQAFLQNYGMSEAEVRRAAPVWRLFNAVNYVPKVDRLLRKADEPALERIRTRLSGALDLYSAGCG